MGCGGCMQARAQFVTSARRYDIHGVAGGVRMAGRVIMEKIHGTYDESRYVGFGQQPAVKATPYQRPPERST